MLVALRASSRYGLCRMPFLENGYTVAGVRAAG
jgi:hypothetical protein